MKKNLQQLHTSHQSGFVLLFSLVVSAIIFLVGAGIFSLSFKELLTSTLAQESQKSIFAADSGVECALASDTQNPFTPDFQDTITCFGQNILPTNSAGVIKFSIAFADSGTCSVVQVDTNDPDTVTVTAQGYNKCVSSDPVYNYPGLTERVYQVSFFR
jgi:hypothetical protein